MHWFLLLLLSISVKGKLAFLPQNKRKGGGKEKEKKNFLLPPFTKFPRQSLRKERGRKEEEGKKKLWEVPSSTFNTASIAVWGVTSSLLVCPGVEMSVELIWI